MLASLLMAGCTSMSFVSGGPAPHKVAVAEIGMCEDQSIMIGEARLEEAFSSEGVKEIFVRVAVEGMTEESGQHAVHVHETGTCTPCGAANGHFDPGPFGHTNPDGNHPFHAGDLINIEVDESGNGVMTTTSSRFTLSEGPLSIFDHDGASIIIHVDPDTYCEGGPDAGCAGGARLACGIFRMVAK